MRYEIVHIDGITDHYVIKIGDDWIAQNENYDPFETEEEAIEYAERNL